MALTRRSFLGILGIAVASVAIQLPKIDMMEPEVVEEFPTLPGEDWFDAFLRQATEYIQSDWIDSGQYEETVFSSTPALKVFREKKQMGFTVAERVCHNVYGRV
jgi:hypothetical protein